MRTFECACQGPLFFENTQCTRCQREVGWCPECEVIVGLDPLDQGFGCTVCAAELAKCVNYAVQRVCNRLVPRANDGGLCDCCVHTRVIPDLDVPGHRERWARLEEAKRRLVYQLDALGLPRRDLDPPLRFEFLADSVPTGPGRWRAMGGEQVMTGHAGGTITIDVQEADDAERERMRLEMGEDYRTLLGHFRHESGHYYWEVLVDPDPQLRADYVALFGDPNQPTYADALERHYSEGAPADWAERFTTPYASMHSWEDFAETWAAYLEIVSTLDTAVHLGLGRRGASPYERAEAIEPLLERYRDLGIDLNEMNRAMGLDDLLTRRFPDPVVEKLAYVDRVVRGAQPR